MSAPFPVAAFAGARVAAHQGFTRAVLHAVEQNRRNLFSAIDERRVGVGHAHQRGFTGAERHGEHGQKVIVRAEFLRLRRHLVHAHLIGEAHGHRVARLFEPEPQGRWTGKFTFLVVLRII